MIPEEDASPYEKGNAVSAIATLLRKIKQDTVRTAYINNWYKKLSLSKKELTDAVQQVQQQADDEFLEDEDTFKNMPLWMRSKSEDLMRDGFCAIDKDNLVGYYAWNKGKVQLTNFIVKPILHIYDKENSRHVIEVKNNRTTVMLDLPSQVFTSRQMFQKYLVGEGNFLIYGSDAYLLLISSTLLDNFHKCREVSQLGYQSQGFFAWVDKVYVNGKGMQDMSPWGIIDVEDQKFLIPANSQVYKDLVHGDNDPYENERKLSYKPNKEVDFKRWAAQVHKVYPGTGLSIITYLLITIFYDIVFSIDNNCPFLYFYGEKGSGKSKAAESLLKPFTHDRAPWQMNSGTDAAFFGYVSLFKNVPNALNEFDDKSVREEWFQAIKGFYEGEGRGRNSLDARNKRKQEVQKATGTVILLGQYLSSKDDNSVVSRSLIHQFSETRYNQEQNQWYNELKKWEDEGLSNLIVEALDHRSHVKEHYYLAFNKILREWRDLNGELFNQRIMQNWCHTATMYYLLHEKLSLPVSFTTYNEYAYDKALQWCKMVRQTDILSVFWDTVEYLANDRMIEYGWDFKVEERSSLKVRTGDNEEVIEFSEPRKILFVRMTNVHHKYMVHHKQAFSEKGMTQENISHYLKNRPYYYGNVKSVKFKHFKYNVDVEIEKNDMDADKERIVSGPKKEVKTTSAFAFDYDRLGRDLEIFTDERDADKADTLKNS